MHNNNEEFAPELVDDQIDWLLDGQHSTSQDVGVLADLRRMYQDDERSLRNVWQRLGLEGEQQTSREQLARTLNPERAEKQSSARAKALDVGRKRHMYQAHKHPLTRHLSLIAAVFVAALIVGSMLWIFTMVRPGTNTGNHNTNTTTGPQSPGLAPGIYISRSKEGLSRLDTRTHKALWQQSLEGITKIIPDGDIVYILQGSLNQTASQAGAVVAIDANNGHILWTHPFVVQSPGKGSVFANTTDMALSAGQLYVGLTTWNQSANTSTGQIYVLNGSDGKQRTVYPATDTVWFLAAGDGVLAVSADSSLQVYDPASGRPLWHVAINAPTNAPVKSVSIVDGFLYAVISTNNEQLGVGQDYIAAYKATTGDRVWKSPAFSGGTLSHFTVDQNIVYFGTLSINAQQQFSGSVYAYDVQSKTQLWSRQVDGGVQSAPVVSDGVVYVGADSGSQLQAHVVALTAEKGDIKWQQALPDSITFGFCVSNGVVYIGDASARTPAPAPDGVYALKAEDGSKLWADTQHGVADIIVPTV